MTSKREKLAKYAHDAWGGWMEYLFEKTIPYDPGEVQGDIGSVLIPKWAVERWKRQIATEYADLSEKEKNSDRLEADKILAIMNKGGE